MIEGGDQCYSNSSRREVISGGVGMSHLSILKFFVSFPYVDCGEDCMCIGINIESGGNESRV